MILKQLKEKICKDLETDELDLNRKECDIIQICSEIIDNKLEEIEILEKENRHLKIQIKNISIEINEMRNELDNI